MKYRPEIDGLRAVAVLSVLFFHLEFSKFSGGFVGVDIFFVISGYLITKILKKDFDRQSFSLFEFYDRRIRRIFPALYVVLLASSIFAYLFLMPNVFQSFCKSLVSSVLFYSNFFFWRETGYFDLASEFKPLLHTWSLSIEEQFYLLYPTFLFLIHRNFKKIKNTLVVSCLILSLVACIYLTRKNPSLAFYFSPGRAWELLLGAVIALEVVPKIKSRVWSEIAAVIGVALILYSVFCFSSKTSFPGYAAILPCLGTAVLIQVTGNGSFLTLMDRLLSNPLMVGIGKISYSLYLWHWPIIVFVKYVTLEKITWQHQMLIIVAVLSLSILSWKFVENPFRSKEGVFKTWSGMFRPLSTVTVLLLVFSLAGIFISPGYPWRFEPNIVKYSQGAEDTNPDRKECHSLPLEKIKNSDLCAIGKSKTDHPSFIVWGDSFADAMMPAFKSSAEENNVNGLFVSNGGCAPILGLNRKIRKNKFDCNDRNTAILEIIKNRKIKNVVFVSGWADSGYSLAGPQEVKAFKAMKSSSVNFSKKDMNVFYFGLDSVFNKMQELGAQVWIVDSIPRPSFEVPHTLALYERFGKDRRLLEINKKVYEAQVFDFHVLMREVQKKYSFQVLQPSDVLCPDQCLVENDGHALYYDHQHLTSYAARMIKPTLQPFFQSLRN